MKDYKVYVCEKCGDEFPNDYQGCLEHEKTHIKPDYYYLQDAARYLCDDKYPSFIKIKMEDGAVIEYHISTMVKEAEQKESPLPQIEDNLLEKPFF